MTTMTEVRVRDLTTDDHGSAVRLVLLDGTTCEGTLLTADLSRLATIERPDKCWPLIRSDALVRAYGLPRDRRIEVAIGLYRDHPIEVAR